ncbi:MAG: hypothetical protein IJW62_00815 [Clostridia bacterium]|nr:hypothetical protein [Clostridia bacterium]
MKSILLSILGIIIFLLLLPLLIGCLLIFLMVQLLLFPFRNAKHKKSYFYRDYGLKYSAEYYCSDWYTFYNAIRANDLPIRCIPHYDKKALLCWIDFTYDGTLFTLIFPELTYDHDNKTFTFADVDDADEPINIPIQQYSKELLSEWNAKVTEEDRCREVIYWVTDSNFVNKDDLPNAMETADFFFYAPKNIAASLEKFIAEHSITNPLSR